MTPAEAYAVLEIGRNVSDAELKENFRWFVKFYHPDNKQYGDVSEFKKILEAYRIVREEREN